jgi:hypothetical protein
VPVVLLPRAPPPLDCCRFAFIELTFGVSASREEDVPVASFLFVVAALALGAAYLEGDRVRVTLCVPGALWDNNPLGVHVPVVSPCSLAVSSADNVPSLVPLAVCFVTPPPGVPRWRCFCSAGQPASATQPRWPAQVAAGRAHGRVVPCLPPRPALPVPSVEEWGGRSWCGRCSHQAVWIQGWSTSGACKGRWWGRLSGHPPPLAPPPPPLCQRWCVSFGCCNVVRTVFQKRSVHGRQWHSVAVHTQWIERTTRTTEG